MTTDEDVDSLTLNYDSIAKHKDELCMHNHEGQSTTLDCQGEVNSDGSYFHITSI